MCLRRRPATLASWKASVKVIEVQSAAQIDKPTCPAYGVGLSVEQQPTRQWWHLRRQHPGARAAGGGGRRRQRGCHSRRGCGAPDDCGLRAASSRRDKNTEPTTARNSARQRAAEASSVLEGWVVEGCRKCMRSLIASEAISCTERSKDANCKRIRGVV